MAHVKRYTGKDGRIVRVWTCSVCKKPFEWGPGAEWYGSLACEHDPSQLVVVCSRKCRKQRTDLVEETDPFTTTWR